MGQKPKSLVDAYVSVYPGSHVSHRRRRR